MIKRDELTHPESCFSKAHIDEPLFVIRANDPNGANTVRHWAAQYHRRKTEDGRPMTPREQAKYAEAMGLALKMDHWRVAT